MALAYQKTASDISVILEPREAAFRIPEASANQWTELRLGAFLSLTTAAADNAAIPAESYLSSTVYDRFCFGLKNSSNNTLPGVTGSTAWGLLGQNAMTNQTFSANGNFRYGNGFAGAGHVGIVNDTTYKVGLGGAAYSISLSANNPTGSSDYALFLGLKFIITNRGTATQQVQIIRASPLTTYTDVSETALRSILVNFDSIDESNPEAAKDANDGATAWDVPDAVFIRFPMLLSRLRLHNVMVMQAVP